MSLKLSICDFCKHYIDGKGDMCCKAFPNGIPLEKIKLEDDGKECANGTKFEEDTTSQQKG